MDEEKVTYFQNVLLHWFSEFGRKFPWREKSASNYEIIIAEILLQRTKAGNVAKFLPAFLDRYPTWATLAKATEAELRSALRPFGLNNLKATRLHRLGEEMKHHQGGLPETKDMVQELSLFGQYTANAFELYVLNKPSALLDVNMARLLERYFSPRRVKDYRFDKQLKQTANFVTNHPRSKEINWAILDYATLVCTSKKPKCDICPLCKKCNFFNLTQQN